MSKHTSGPWWVEINESDTSVESKFFTIASDVSNEDASLIAAAPELLNQLKLARRQLDANGMTAEELAPIDAAIAQAEDLSPCPHSFGHPVDPSKCADCAAESQQTLVDFPCASCQAPNDSNNLESKYCNECQRDRDLSAAEALEDR